VMVEVTRYKVTMVRSVTILPRAMPCISDITVSAGLAQDRQYRAAGVSGAWERGALASSGYGKGVGARARPHGL
jgi:hypothetical protein